MRGGERTLIPVKNDSRTTVERRSSDGQRQEERTDKGKKKTKLRTRRRVGDKKRREGRYKEEISYMAESKKGNSTNPWYIQCLNWCWNHRLAVTGMVAALVAIWFWRFWLLNYGKDNWIIDCWYLNFIEGSKWLNILIFIYTIYIATVWGYYTCWFKRRWYHLFIYGIFIATMWIVPAFLPVSTPINALKYHAWATIVIGTLAALETIFLIYVPTRSPKEVANNSGFIDHIAKEQHQKTGWDTYADTILSMIGAAQLQEESFTIGISGSWGSGKTTFYNIIKKNIDKKGELSICEFKPWQIISYSQISAQFFTTFKNHLIKRGVLPESDLISDISNYSGFLESMPKVSEYARPIISAIHASEDTSLQFLHNQIETILVNHDIQIAVMIDDLDRLSQNELMEVLRLIRISANFKNVLFIVTYDKNHIAKVLGKDGKEYLKKIVNVEISLPTIENYKYSKLLLDNISRIVPNLSKEQLDELRGAFRAQNKTTHNMLLNRYSHNFRDLLRFSNQFGLILKHLQSSHLLNEHNIFDLFWLEMLHYFDEDTYYQLQEHPLTLLDRLESNYTKQAYLQLKQNKNNEQEIKSKDIIEVLFDTNRTNYENTIIWLNNFNNYFAHRLLDNAVSLPEFTACIGGSIYSSTLYKQIEKWHIGHTRFSLMNVINSYPHNNIFSTELSVINYLRVLFNLHELYALDIDSLKTLFRIKSHSTFFTRINKKHLKLLLRRTIATHPGLEWNYLLSSMCVKWNQEMIEWDDPSRFENEFIFTHEELEELAQLNYVSCFRNKQMTLSELFDPNSSYTRFINTLSYISYQDTDEKNNKIEHSSNLIGNFIVSLFEDNNTTKGNANEFAHVYDNLIRLAGVQGDEDESWIYDIIQETIEQYIGSKKNLETIINHHFILDEKYTKLCNDLGIKIKT